MQKQPILWALGLLLVGFAMGFLISSQTGKRGVSTRDLNLGIRHHVSAPYIPNRLDFAGEPVPLHIPDVRERLERELLINAYWESNTMRMMKLANRWFPLIDSLLKENQVPSDFKYLPIVESRFSNEISARGAAGFWHLMPATARELGLTVNDEMDERYHPVLSTLAAIRFLKKAKEMFGTWTMAAGAYNRGMNGLRRAVNHQKQNNYHDIKLNDESARYLSRILAFKVIFTEPKKQGFYLKSSDLYGLPGMKEEFVDRPTDWVRFSESHGLSYKHLRIWNPWIQDKRFRDISGKGITVWVLTEPQFSDSSKPWDSVTSPVDTLGIEFWDPWSDSLYIDRVE